jgi:hypothetical protein
MQKRTSWWNSVVKAIVEDKKKAWKRFLRAKTKEVKRKFWGIIKSLGGKYGKRGRSVKNRENELETEATEVLEDSIMRKNFGQKKEKPES